MGKHDLASLARGPDGSLWVGTDEGLGLARFKDGAVKPFVTPTFDGSRFAVTSMMFDRDGNLWVGTDAKGSFVSMEILWRPTVNRWFVRRFRAGTF